MDCKAEVLKKIPNAFCDSYYICWGEDRYYITTPAMYEEGDSIGATGNSEEKAWQNAFEYIQKINT